MPEPFTVHLLIYGGAMPKRKDEKPRGRLLADIVPLEITRGGHYLGRGDVIASGEATYYRMRLGKDGPVICQRRMGDGFSLETNQLHYAQIVEMKGTITGPEEAAHA